MTACPKCDHSLDVHDEEKAGEVCSISCDECAGPCLSEPVSEEELTAIMFHAESLFTDMVSRSKTAGDETSLQHWDDLAWEAAELFHARAEIRARNNSDALFDQRAKAQDEKAAQKAKVRS